MYNDDDINVEVDDRNDEVVQYGGVGVNNNLRAVLSLNPKMIMSVDREEEEDEEEWDKVVDLERRRSTTKW